MAVIKGTNVTVNWYKSTKTLQIQGVNEQMVKQLIWTSNHNGSQVITDGKDTSQVEFDSRVTKGDNATFVAFSSNEGFETYLIIKRGKRWEIKNKIEKVEMKLKCMLSDDNNARFG